MERRRNKFAIRQVLVALDGSSHSLAALRLAIELAAHTNAELSGLFVEDTRLLRLAASARAREVLYPSATPQLLNGPGMEQRLRAQAEQAEQALASSALEARVRWSFRVARGDVTSEVLTAASDADVLVLGKSGWSVAEQLRLGSTALAAAHAAPRSLLLVPGGARFRQQVLVVDEGAHESLGAAAQLAASYGNRLIVLIAAKNTTAADTISRQVRRLLRPHAVHLHLELRRLQSADVLSIAHAVQFEGGGILVMQQHRAETVSALARHLEGPILLLR